MVGVFLSQSYSFVSGPDYFSASVWAEILIYNPLGSARNLTFLSAFLCEGTTSQVPQIGGWIAPPLIQSLMLPKFVQRLGSAKVKRQGLVGRAPNSRAGVFSIFSELQLLGAAIPFLGIIAISVWGYMLECRSHGYCFPMSPHNASPSLSCQAPQIPTALCAPKPRLSSYK